MSDSIEIVLSDMNEWQAFADANREALIDSYGSIDEALQHATQGGLTLGGGAAPLFVITFAD